MDRLAKELEPKTVASVFVYSHEAHPGEHYPHHISFEQKMAHARKFVEIFDVKRPVLVDNLSGDCHRAYGSMPNMCWILARGAMPVYKADWTNVNSVRSAMHDLLAMVEQRKASRQTYGSFHVERLEYRLQDREGFMNGLKRDGQKAVDEFVAQTERWREAQGKGE